MRKSPKFLKKLLPGILFLIGLIATAVYGYQQHDGISILVENHELKDLVTWTDAELLAGNKIVGSFQAEENYLGIVAVRFDNLFRINDDILIFRLRRKDQQNWYYQNTYKVDQFQPHLLFPFGFPPIGDSRGKEYLFEIESTAGIPQNAIALDVSPPIFVSKYKFPREIVLGELSDSIRFSSKKMLTLNRDQLQEILVYGPKLFAFHSKTIASFLVKKIVNLSINTDFLMKSFFYFNPLIFYFLWMALTKRFGEYLYTPLTFPLFASLTSTLVLQKIDDFIALQIILIWLYLARHYKTGSRITLFVSILFMILAAIGNILGASVITSNSLTWSLFYLATYVAQETKGLYLSTRDRSPEKIMRKIIPPRSN